MNTSVKITGTVKFFSQEKCFGFISTKEGDVFIGNKAAGDNASLLVSGATVDIDFITKWVDGAFKRETTSLISVTAPLPPVKPPEPLRATVLDTVIWFNQKKGIGFMHCSGHGFSRDQAFIHASTLRGIVPGAGMALKAVVVEDKKGPAVKSFEWGNHIEAAYRAQLAELHAEDGAVIDGEDVAVGDPLDAMFVEPAVDDMLDQYRRDTMRDIGQLPPEAIEVAVIATPKKKKKPAQPRRVPAKAITTPVAIDAELIAHGDPATPNCPFAGLAALTSGSGISNGELVH